MQHAPVFRLCLIGFLIFVMSVPAFFAAEIIAARKSYSRNTIETLSQEWGGPQSFAGPQLVVPVVRQMTVTKTRLRTDSETGAILYHPETGKELEETYRENETVQQQPVYLFPERYDVDINLASHSRSRGIFNVPVYQSTLQIAFDFDTGLVADHLGETETALWDQAYLTFRLSNLAGVRGETILQADGQTLGIEPMSGVKGMRVALGDPRSFDKYNMTLGLNGAREFYLSPVGRINQIDMVGNWPDPSFSGSFLPDRHDVATDGFTATWTVPNLARSFPQTGREDTIAPMRRDALLGLRLIEENDFYQKAFRASKYALLFISLTFLTIFLIERGAPHAAHPVHYVFVGLAQSMFVLLMVSYAEHFGFDTAYILSAAVTICVLSLYTRLGMKFGKRSWLMSLSLMILYGLFYMILQSADFALLAGSTVGFSALVLTMFATRDEDWTGVGKGLMSSIVAKAPDVRKMEPATQHES